MLLSEHKRANMLGAKSLIEKVGTSYLKKVPWSPQQVIPDHCLYLSIQLQKFLSRTYPRFLYMSLCTWVCVCVCVCVLVNESVCECVCFSMWVSVFIRVRHVGKVWICSAEEFLELYGKVEAVVRNCLLRWSGHLFVVSSTHLFDQSFCFKHISLLSAPIGAFFRWYPPFPCYTKDFTCRNQVTLNPCTQ